MYICCHLIHYNYDVMYEKLGIYETRVGVTKNNIFIYIYI